MTTLLLLLTLAQPPVMEQAPPVRVVTTPTQAPPTRSASIPDRAPPVRKATPVVVAPRPFRSGDYHASHWCPNCGREQKRVLSGVPDVPGHTHQCPACKTVWWH